MRSVAVNARYALQLLTGAQRYAMEISNRQRYLPAAYSGALALVSPSLYEGFGLPLLEAMACGTPVITSGVTAMPEVLGGAGIIVPPCDAGAIAEAMLAIAGSESLRADCSAKGLARAREFSWDRSAARMWELLEREAAA